MRKVGNKIGKFTFFTLVTLTAATMAVSLPAQAGGGRYGHGGYHGGGYSHARVGVYIGAPVIGFGGWWGARPYYPYAYYPSYYYSPAPVVVRERVVVQEPLTYYDENGNPVSAQPQVAQAPAQAPQQPAAQPPANTQAPTWYYCADSQKYFPYVQSCASPWQRVVPQSPPQ